MASIVLSGDVLRRPTGSNVAAHLQYLIGLRRLGHQVVYVENTGIDEGDREATVPRAGLVLMRDLLRRCHVDVPVVWVDQDAGLVGGMVWPQLRRRLGKAELLIDLGGHCWIEGRSLARRRVLIELDGSRGLRAGHHQLEHDVYFSPRRGPSSLPGVEWLPTIPPVVPRLWYGPPARPELPVRVRADAPGPSPGTGRPGAHGISPEQMLSLPGRTSARLWAALPAVSDSETTSRLRDAGWSIRREAEVDASLSSFRTAMLGSQALLGAYGDASWFAALDACHLAAGRPVVVMGADLDSWLPTGHGLIAAADLDAAIDALEQIGSDLVAHAAAARTLATTVFDYRIVLPALLEQALPRSLRVAA